MRIKTKCLFILGTRPEAIKMAPIIYEMRKSKQMDFKVCVTAQHRQLLDQVLAFFKIVPDYDLNIMRKSQTLFVITSNGLRLLQSVFYKYKPDLVLVQGDTTTAMLGALAAYYCKVKVVHIEAGLRTGNKFFPYPEEMNRCLISRLADFNFCPTYQNALNLKAEGVKSNVWVVGNTVIDALLLCLRLIKEKGEQYFVDMFLGIDFKKRIILVTAHRRENFGKPFHEVLAALKDIAMQFNDIEIVYPIHFNPNVRVPALKILRGVKNIHLIEPLDYASLVYMLNKSYFVLTDSGGIQEEAPALSKPVLVMRSETERMEGVRAGTAILVGPNKNIIIQNVCRLLTNHRVYTRMANAVNPYGKGDSAKLIVRKLIESL
jgi:UDP-N-acetylglucosamine 2-epimerase (non-hydrolysing)